MRHKRLILSVVILLSLGLTELQAQEALPVTGGNASGSGGMVSYSVGQVVYTTATGTTGSVKEGVQQPYEISTVTSLEEVKDISLRWSAFPNPATDFLILKIDASTTLYNQSFNYQLFDINGKLLESKKIEGDETSIVMSKLNPATYFLKVSEGNKEVKSFKIIKN